METTSWDNGVNAVRKYELTKYKKKVDDKILTQIVAVKNFSVVDFTKKDKSHNVHQIRIGDLGGWIENEENLSQEGNCWITSNAAVYGNAKVYENGLVLGNARVFEASQVHGNAIIFDNASVSGKANVFGFAVVRSNAKVMENVKVFGYARLGGDCAIYGSAEISGAASIYDYAVIMGNAKVSGYDTYVGGNAFIMGNAVVSTNLYDRPTLQRGIRSKEEKLGLSYRSFYTNEILLENDEQIGGNAVIHNVLDFLTFKHPLRSFINYTWTRSDNLWRGLMGTITEDEFINEMRDYGEISEKIAKKYVELAHIFAELAPLIDEGNC